MYINISCSSWQHFVIYLSIKSFFFHILNFILYNFLLLFFLLFTSIENAFFVNIGILPARAQYLLPKMCGSFYILVTDEGGDAVLRGERREQERSIHLAGVIGSYHSLTATLSAHPSQLSAVTTKIPPRS